MKEIQKSQAVRVFDFLVYGPVLMRLSRELPGWKGEVLWLFGAGAAVYNFVNWYANERAKENPRIARG
ncbi:MAG: hypothetical protein EB121_01895 [Alphaproteobacteria bacterium]|nr:hypothetical protein [Alphaproteobacteria bacterium]